MKPSESVFVSLSSILLTSAALAFGGSVGGDEDHGAATTRPDCSQAAATLATDLCQDTLAKEPAPRTVAPTTQPIGASLDAVLDTAAQKAVSQNLFQTNAPFAARILTVCCEDEPDKVWEQLTRRPDVLTKATEAASQPRTFTLFSDGAVLGASGPGENSSWPDPDRKAPARFEFRNSGRNVGPDFNGELRGLRLFTWKW